MIGPLVGEPSRRRFGLRTAPSLDLFGTVALLGALGSTTNPYVIGAGLVAAGVGASRWRVVTALHDGDAATSA